jgi:hypothetical protein
LKYRSHKGTTKGKGLSIGDVAEKAGLDVLKVRAVLTAGKGKAYGMDGARGSATWYLKG